jgi:hypothetical protein
MPKIRLAPKSKSAYKPNHVFPRARGIFHVSSRDRVQGKTVAVRYADLASASLRARTIGPSLDVARGGGGGGGAWKDGPDDGIKGGVVVAESYSTLLKLSECVRAAIICKCKMRGLKVLSQKKQCK